jgi:FixJ family two-component response regulator
MADTRRCVVAVIDDDHGVRESLKFLLETWGHKVATLPRRPHSLPINWSDRPA